MTWLSIPRSHALAPWLVATATLAACQMPNPEFDGLADDTETGRDPSDAGDGDGDPTEGSSSSTTGDGDGDTTTTTTGDGDGDGDTTTTTGDGDGDGDGDPNSCLPDQQLCGDTCIDPLEDFENCGVCGNICVGGFLCGLGECVPKRYVFVTSSTHNGNFEGLETANGICNERAMEAQLPGTYRAWLSDGEVTPAAVFEGGPAAFTLRNGPILAYSFDDFTDGSLLSPINRDEYGNPIEPTPWEDPECDVAAAVWTGSNNKGDFVGPVCLGWATTSAEVYGTVGNAASAEAWGNAQCPAACNQALPFYCVQE